MKLHNAICGEKKIHNGGQTQVADWRRGRCRRGRWFGQDVALVVRVVASVGEACSKMRKPVDKKAKARPPGRGLGRAGAACLAVDVTCLLMLSRSRARRGLRLCWLGLNLRRIRRCSPWRAGCDWCSPRVTSITIAASTGCVSQTRVCATSRGGQPLWQDVLQAGHAPARLRDGQTTAAHAAA